MSTSQEEESIGNWDEPAMTLRELVGEERSPVEESFYESYIIQSRTAVDNLYASNVLSCQKHMKVMGDLARQRKVKLSSLEKEQNKLLKRMENLKEKHFHMQKRLNTISNDIKSSRSKSTEVEQGDTDDNFNSNHRRRGSLPQLQTMATDTGQTSKIVKSSDRLSVPGNMLCRSCNDVTSLCKKDSSKESILFLPAIKPSRSQENLSVSPFITRFPSKVHKYPHSTKGPVSRERLHLAGFPESRDSKSSWNAKNFKTEHSTKVKWVPRN